MNIKERKILNRTRSIGGWVFVILLFVLYWNKSLREDIDWISDKNKSLSVVIESKDNQIFSLVKTKDSLLKEITKPKPITIIEPTKKKILIQKLDSIKEDTIPMIFQPNLLSDPDTIYPEVIKKDSL